MMDNVDWKAIKNLREPYNDAINYQSRAYKDFFQRLFLKTEEMEQCLAPSIYFLMGEKGTGKTAYAVYLENNDIKGHRCKLTTMTETQYKRFIELKKQGKLSYSDYANIWRSMLLFITGRMLVEKSKTPLHFITGKFSKIEKEIASWSKNALNPEIESAFEAINTEALSMKLKSDQLGEAGGEHRKQNTDKSSVLKHHLLETENSFKEVISSLKLSEGHVLFIDGIDFRPESISYSEYIECIKGLGEAVWQLNTDYFNRIRDSKGRIKIVLLIRPDVFHALNLYNSNSRLQDNCVFLDWKTTEREYESSKLLEVSGKYFSSQQDFESTPMSAWEHYFFVPNSPGHVFRKLLKNSFQKPRDILTFIKIVQKYYVKQSKGSQAQFSPNIVAEPAITREYSDYLLGEVKNYSAFYMRQEDFNKYIKFFQYLNGRGRFTMTDFSKAFESFKAWADGEQFYATEYLRDADSLLQFLYDVNVVGYSESEIDHGDTFFHWSYRERSANNIAPQVKSTGTLMLNPGIHKALDIGKVMSGNAGPEGPHRKLHSAHRKNRRK
jgi:hypothetical protein